MCSIYFEDKTWEMYGRLSRAGLKPTDPHEGETSEEQPGGEQPGADMDPPATEAPSLNASQLEEEEDGEEEEGELPFEMDDDDGTFAS